MASISKTANGRRIIQFTDSNRKRRTIRLGAVPQRTAEMVRHRVELLNAAAIAGHAADAETLQWAASLDDVLYDRLVRVGLVQSREHQRQTTLKQYLDAYVNGRADVKGSTAVVYGHTRRNLIDYFGASKPLRDITAGEADAWRIWLAKEASKNGRGKKDDEKQKGLSDNTVRRRCGIAKQFFRAAVRRKLITDNPFADLAGTVKANAKRYYFVTRDEAQKVIDACPDAQWRLLFALSRYGGLRCPSEHLGLRWEDVDWASGKMTVHSPKTEHHEGGESRQVPIFPELLPYLSKVREQAEPGTTHVITRYRDTNANLRTRLYKIIKRAGLKPWPKLFQNLRSTRETELAKTYPMHMVCAWIGNTQAVAAKFYLQVTDADFEQAATASPDDCSALRNALQQAHATTGRGSQDDEKTPGIATTCESVLADSTGGMGGTGLEPVTSTV